MLMSLGRRPLSLTLHCGLLSVPLGHAPSLSLLVIAPPLGSSMPAPVSTESLGPLSTPAAWGGCRLGITPAARGKGLGHAAAEVLVELGKTSLLFPVLPGGTGRASWGLGVASLPLCVGFRPPTRQ